MRLLIVGKDLGLVASFAYACATMGVFDEIKVSDLNSAFKTLMGGGFSHVVMVMDICTDGKMRDRRERELLDLISLVPNAFPALKDLKIFRVGLPAFDEDPQYIAFGSGPKVMTKLLFSKRTTADA